MFYWYVFEDGFCACVKGYSKIELRHEIKKHGKVVNKYIAWKVGILWKLKRLNYIYTLTTHKYKILSIWLMILKTT